MSERHNESVNEYSPASEMSFDESWREFRRLLMIYIEDLKDNQEKQEVSLNELEKVVMEIKIEQKVTTQKHYYITGAIGFIFGVIGYAIQYFWFTK